MTEAIWKFLRTSRLLLLQIAPQRVTESWPAPCFLGHMRFSIQTCSDLAAMEISESICARSMRY
jgi:hypothetical protein